MAGRRQSLITRITHPTAKLVEESSPSGCKVLEMNFVYGLIIRLLECVTLNLK